MVIEMPRQLPHPPPSPPSQALLAPTLAAPSSFAGWRSSIPVSPSYALDLSCMWVSSRRRARSFHRLAHSPVPTVNVVGSRLFGAGSAAPASARHSPPPPRCRHAGHAGVASSGRRLPPDLPAPIVVATGSGPATSRADPVTPYFFQKE
jgi:hypothetical protein